jgi:endo-alpha-1,4-polygalactosaminidase (GH114 family)
LAWNDTYTVRFLSNRWNVKSVVTDVFFDELAEVIDDKVERIGVYEF